MPWTVTNPPPPAKNWTVAQRRRCVDAANEVLERTGDEEQAVQACIRAAGETKAAAEAVTLAEDREEVRAAIREATQKAQERMNELDGAALEDLDRIYRRAAEDIRSAIHDYADRDNTLRQEVLQDLLGQAEQRLDELAEAQQGLLDESLPQAATLGAEPFAAATGAAAPRIADEAVRFVREFTAADGLQLSDRIWRINQGAQEAVEKSIKDAVAQGKSASQAAQDFLDRGEDVPEEIRARQDLAKADRVARVTGEQLMTARGNPRDNAMRLFRTELNRAHGEAYIAGAEDQPDFGGHKFNLSPAHPRPDECDMHATANLHGLGPGVYPDRDSCPWPAHPNTLSYVTIVFTDEVRDEDRQGQTDALSWLERQPASRQEAVLGSQKKREALERGILEPDDILTPWHVLRERYAQRGIDI
ncbi:MAG: hypothetical protein ACLFRB_06870 [Thiohalorhabdus sp.]|uniref:hypothetical protein n=1 Tax=Thiohalorhabdus sp. TaxID=3094134 RepID=UPI00398155C0